eukprot:TRINITY_DN23874_c0_g1_i1.p1 TRINITY_DN23874_c0_g1~~TRINITY_DN23874_c0_g1_i1.p1  ORF type:complete len:311 (-),score=47.06 TRINITY_DN23874_c0_g1_i1:327-1259(-)
MLIVFFFQAEDGIRDAQESRGLGDVYKRQVSTQSTGTFASLSMNASESPARHPRVPETSPRPNPNPNLHVPDTSPRRHKRARRYTDSVPRDRVCPESAVLPCGLVLLPEWLLADEQAMLLKDVMLQYNFKPPMNQAMCFGDLPRWARTLAECIEPFALGHFPEAVMAREPLFDQMIVNLYHRGQGIKSHVDLPKFADGIAVLSLSSSCVMEFKPATEHNRTDSQEFGILLQPGDLLLLSQESRYHWEHAIPEVLQDTWNKQLRPPRAERLSVTLRALLPIEARAAAEAKFCERGISGYTSTLNQDPIVDE